MNPFSDSDSESVIGTASLGVSRQWGSGCQCCSRDLLVRDQDRDRDLTTRDRDKTETFRVRDQIQASETETLDIRDRDQDRDLQYKSCVKGSRLGTFCPYRLLYGTVTLHFGILE